MIRNTLIQLAALTALISFTGLSEADSQDAGLIDIAAKVGVAQNSVAYCVVVGDYDGNGLPDFLFNRRWALPFLLYKNTGGVFIEDILPNFAVTDRLDCKWGDANVDGRPDLYCSHGAGYGTKVKANELWIQQADGSFREEAKAWNVIDPYGRGREVEWLNFNGDKYPDLFVGNAFPRVDTFPSFNRLFVNQGGTSFRELKIPGFTSEIGALNSFVVDIDLDGFDDLVICGNKGLHIYRNTRGTGFVDMASELNLTERCRDAFAADLTGDGRPDLVLVRDKVSIYINNGNWQFRAAQVFSSPGGYSAVAADIDGDKDLDIYVSTTNSPGTLNPPDLLFQNRGNGYFDAKVVSTSTKEGMGGRCESIDHDNDGRFSVLVVNCTGVANSTFGPLQLMTIDNH